MSPFLYFLIFPLVGALVGGFTNWLAILMLLRPREPVRIFWWSLQGVIPSRHAQLAERIADTVENSLLTQDDLEKAMSGVNWHDEVDSLIRKVLHERGPGGIIEKIPGISQAWNRVVLPSLQEVLSREVVRFIDGHSKRFAHKLRESVDIREIVRVKVMEFETEVMENLIMAVAKKEFGHIQVVGAITGAVIGVVQGIVMLMVG
jgi:uncharacterized membrane protein YheB (UPF0754 family)